MVVTLIPEFFHFGDDLFAAIKAKVNALPCSTARRHPMMVKKYRKILLDVVVPCYIRNEPLFTPKTHILFL